MSVELMGKVWGLDLTRVEANILLVLCDAADDDGTNCFPGVGRVAWKSRYDERTVRETMRDFEDRGVLKRCSRGRGGEGYAVYEIDLSPIPKRAPYIRKAGKPGRKRRKSTGSSTRLISVRNPVGNPVENSESTGDLEQINRGSGTNHAGIQDIKAESHLLLSYPSSDPSYGPIHDSADAGPVENSLAVIKDKRRWTLASNDPGGLPTGVVYDLCGGDFEKGIPPDAGQAKRLIGFLVDSSFSGLAVFQLSQVIKARVNGKRINSVGYYFDEIRRLEQLCNLVLAKPERLGLLAGATPEQLWDNELATVRRMVDRWRKG